MEQRHRSARQKMLPKVKRMLYNLGLAFSRPKAKFIGYADLLVLIAYAKEFFIDEEDDAGDMGKKQGPPLRAAIKLEADCNQKKRNKKKRLVHIPMKGVENIWQVPRDRAKEFVELFAGAVDYEMVIPDVAPQTEEAEMPATLDRLADFGLPQGIIDILKKNALTLSAAVALVRFNADLQDIEGIGEMGAAKIVEAASMYCDSINNPLKPAAKATPVLAITPNDADNESPPEAPKLPKRNDNPVAKNPAKPQAPVKEKTKEPAAV